REAYIEETVKRGRLIHGTFAYDENQAREYRTKEYDRNYYPEGIARQLAAMAVPGNLKPKLAAIRAPTLVVHGREDPFNPVEAGKDIATAILGAELLILDGMGHSLPREVMPRILNGLVAISNKNDQGIEK
ncbi:MAG: alpha/beta hydrolase, partial [Candidatus Lokiarchaeota archaeon]|nr:alpha/beta hydrolase [Candidatus Lokiarchaeota archaeon]